MNYLAASGRGINMEYFCSLVASNGKLNPKRLNFSNDDSGKMGEGLTNQLHTWRLT